MKKCIIILSVICCLAFAFGGMDKAILGVSQNDAPSSQIIKRGDPNRKLVALTFDDGPHPRFTPEILKILKENNAKATFFVIGKHVQYYPNILKMIIDSGNEIGNHTYSHLDMKRKSNDRIEEEISKTQEIIFLNCGVKPILFRPPFGRCDKNIIKIADDNGCKMVLWTANQDTKDWNHPSSNRIIKSVLNDVQNGDIILMHDYVDARNQSIEALKTILPELKKLGFECVTISELIGKK